MLPVLCAGVAPPPPFLRPVDLTSVPPSVECAHEAVIAMQVCRDRGLRTISASFTYDGGHSSAARAARMLASRQPARAGAKLGVAPRGAAAALDGRGATAPAAAGPPGANVALLLGLRRDSIRDASAAAAAAGAAGTAPRLSLPLPPPLARARLGAYRHHRVHRSHLRRRHAGPGGGHALHPLGSLRGPRRRTIAPVRCGPPSLRC